MELVGVLLPQDNETSAFIIIVRPVIQGDL